MSESYRLEVQGKQTKSPEPRSLQHVRDQPGERAVLENAGGEEVIRFGSRNIHLLP